VTVADVEPVYVDDRDSLALWHNGVVYVLFEFGVEHAGLVHCPQGFAWPKPACTVCGCATRGDGCWYCQLEAVA
jgi:hypothetical protein